MTDEDTILAGELALELLDGEERAATLRRVLADPAFAREVDRWRKRFATLLDGMAPVAPGADVESRVMARTDARPRYAGVWRWMAIAASVAAAVLLFLLVGRPTPPAVPTSRPPSLLVTVFEPDDAAAFGAVYDDRSRELRVRGSVTAQPGHDLELWAIGSDGVPHAAALLPRKATARVVARAGTAIVAGTTLAISVEPIGGSPKPTPTGPVIAKGKLVAI